MTGRIPRLLPVATRAALLMSVAALTPFALLPERGAAQAETEDASGESEATDGEWALLPFSAYTPESTARAPDSTSSGSNSAPVGRPWATWTSPRTPGSSSTPRENVFILKVDYWLDL